MTLLYIRTKKKNNNGIFLEKKIYLQYAGDFEMYVISIFMLVEKSVGFQTDLFQN